MKVFISRSGSTSHKVAIALREWLPSVLQSVDPYVSSEDIDKGARWSTDISQELEDSAFGIICVTRDNIDAPWVNFESGALSKSLDKSRVAPFLFGVERTAVQGPLLQFQSTLVEEGEVKKLLKSINGACDGGGLDESRLDDVFTVWWPRLQQSLGEIESEKPTTGPTKNRSSQDLMAEVLELVRNQQALLANPEQLLPPSYLSSVLSVPREMQVASGAWRHLELALRELDTVLEENDDETPEAVRHAAREVMKPARYLVSNYREYYPRRRVVRKKPLQADE